MSKIGKKPIPVPEGVEVQIDDGEVIARREEMQRTQGYDENYVDMEVKEGRIFVTRNGEGKSYRERHGLYRSLVQSLVKGLEEPFKKELRIEGLGYKARLQGNKMMLDLGYSHPIEYPLQEEVEAEVEDGTKITLRSVDKQAVGQAAAEIKNFRPPEPYKGKGIKYKGEEIIRKEGKLAGGEEAGLGGS